MIRRIRDGSQVPIIVLSVRDGEDNKVQALDAGADDYLIKPFGVAELRAKIAAGLFSAPVTMTRSERAGNISASTAGVR